MYSKENADNLAKLLTDDSAIYGNDGAAAIGASAVATLILRCCDETIKGYRQGYILGLLISMPVGMLGAYGVIKGVIAIKTHMKSKTKSKEEA